MRECLPPDGGSIAARTLRACLAALLEVPVAALPLVEAEDEWTGMTGWLATRNRVVVPVLDPAAFSFADFWLARLGAGAGRRYVVMAGTPSGIVWDPLPGPDADIEAGWILTAPAPRLCIDDRRRSGTVHQLFRISASGRPASEVQEATLIPGVGVEGDRYATGRGHFWSAGRTGQDITLIESESLDALAAEHGIELPAGAHRRNVVTRGIDLHGLVGSSFRIGAVECYGQRLAEPCSWMQTTTPPGTLRGLVHRGGVRADIVGTGTITLGDPVERV